MIIKNRIQVFAIALSLPVFAQAASFTPLVSPKTRVYFPQILNSRATAVTADGSTVYINIDPDPYPGGDRWTRAAGFTGEGGANDVSSDGRIRVGERPYTTTYSEAYRYSATDARSVIPIGAGFFTSYATATSADGSVVVGHGYGDDQSAFRWTLAGGSELLDNDLTANGRRPNSANDVAADGIVVVGSAGGEAYRWTSSGGTEGLGYLPGFDSSSTATSVSADGNIIVGDSQRVPFRWTADGGMVALNELLPEALTNGVAVNGVSGDGDTVVGSVFSSGGRYAGDSEAFIWTEDAGMQTLADFLILQGVDLGGWSINTANAISTDGFTVVGAATDANGDQQSYVANISTVPPPGTAWLFGSALVGIISVTRRRLNKGLEK